MDLRPTPVERLEGFGSPGSSLWVKRDDLSHPRYGGNKPRKLRVLLELSLREGARRVVTVGAAGSHHVLATALFGRESGLRVAAVLTPQSRTPHAVETLRAALGQGLEAVPARHPAELPLVLARLFGRGDVFLPPGGSNIAGTLAYASAVAELRRSVEAAQMPPPDLLVVAVGSGGTAAGLAAGLVREGLGARVLGVAVNGAPRASVGLTRALAALAGSRLGGLGREAAARVHIEGRFGGEGYGVPSEAGSRAGALGARAGLTLDPTYTEKAFAAALARVEAKDSGTVLFWHTLSSAPMAPLLEGAPAESDLPAELRALFR